MGDVSIRKDPASHPRLSQNRDPPGLPDLIGVQPQEVHSRRERTRTFGIQLEVVNSRLDHPVDKGTDPAAGDVEESQVHPGRSCQPVDDPAPRLHRVGRQGDKSP